MSASNEECIAAFQKQQCVLDRVFARTLAWSAYITAQSLPPTDTAPDKAAVEQRILAERFPLTGQMNNVPGICGYLIAVPNISQKVREHLSPWNDEATEQGLATDIDTSLATVMPIYCGVVVTDQEVANWCDEHGYPRPPNLVNVFTPPVINPP